MSNTVIYGYTKKEDVKPMGRLIVAEALMDGKLEFNNPDKLVVINFAKGSAESIYTTLREVVEAAVFTNTYDGVVMLDVSCFTDNIYDGAMEIIVNFVKKELNDALVVFTFDSNNVDKSYQLQNFITRNFGEVRNLEEGGIDF